MSKHAFWQALVFTVIIFSLGMMLGFFLELRQTGSIYSELVASELSILDEQLRQKIIVDSNLSCTAAKKSLFEFADKIYYEALELEEIDNVGRISDLITLHKRYDLLRTMLLFEAKSLKERCNDEFHIVNYIYLYREEGLETSSKQNYFSKQIFDLKSKYPQEILIIPIAADTGVASVDVFLNSIQIYSYPVIIVDDEDFIYEFITLEELEGKVFN